MAEIKQLNLTQPIYNPMNDGGESLAENLRKSAEAKFTRQMRAYNQKKMEREEADYRLGKRTENFVFSNYPSSKVQGEFGEAVQNLRFGPGSKNKWREKWKKSVGGNMQGFEQWYATSKASELKGIQRTLVRDPSVFLTEESWTDHINDIVNGMDPNERRLLVGHLQDDPTTYNMFNSVYSPTKDRTVDTILQHFKDDPIAYGALGTAMTVFTGFMLARKGNYKAIGDMIKRKGGILTKQDTFDLPNELKRSFITADKFSEKQLAEMAKRGLISKAQLEALKKGDAVIPDAFMRGGARGKPKTGQMDLFEETIDTGPKTARFINSDINKFVKDGTLSQAQGDQLKGVINKMIRDGEVVSPKALMDKISGKQFSGLRDVLNAKQDIIPGFGPLKNPGLFRGALYAGGLYKAGEYMAEGVGLGETGQTITGMGMSHLAPVAPAMISKVKDVAQDRGISYLVKKLTEAGSWKLAARVASKGLIGGPLGIGLALFDLYTIYNLIKDD